MTQEELIADLRNENARLRADYNSLLADFIARDAYKQRYLKAAIDLENVAMDFRTFLNDYKDNLVIEGK